MDNNQNSNTFRVAIASTDGYICDTHFGRADSFYIYQFLVDEWIYVEKREVMPVCQNGQHIINDMSQRVEEFADCKYIVAARIGQGAIAAIQSAGIIAMNLPGEINDILQKIFSYNEIQRLME
ncbi:MAG: hypothetical protein K6F33_00240 [Bacteroidales bacterium]|nr:hypothetical protein [Bacteroidales bacterium]